MPQHLRILIAEDNRINQILTKTFLQRLGHTVEVATTGLEAVMAVTTNYYDVILMDIQMPEMDGVEATRLIRLLPSNRSITPIIAVPADVIDEHCVNYLQAGINLVTAKPINWNNLLSMIAKLTTTLYLLP